MDIKIRCMQTLNTTCEYNKIEIKNEHQLQTSGGKKIKRTKIVVGGENRNLQTTLDIKYTILGNQTRYIIIWKKQNRILNYPSKKNTYIQAETKKLYMI